MAQLIPENATRKLDALGRITLPKGLRDRMFLSDNAELELLLLILMAANVFVFQNQPLKKKSFNKLLIF